MKAACCLAVSLVLAGTAVAVAHTVSFDRYQIILERKPFGAAGDTSAAAAATTTPAKPATDTFAKGLRLTFLGELPSGLRVGLVSAAQTNQSFYLGVGEKNEEGIELISVNYAAEEATLRKGAETVVIKLTPTSTNAAAVASVALPAPRALPPPPDPSGGRRSHRYGEATEAGGGHSHGSMQQRLQEYQMRAIRGGMPPLPIPLTPEMDAQLVKEGVLPPQN